MRTPLFPTALCAAPRFTVVAIVLGLLWCGATPAWAQYQNGYYGDSSDLTSRIGRLENEVATLNRQLHRGGSSGTGAAGDALAPTQAADFEIRLSRLERSVQEMIGKYEEAVFGVTQARERLEKLASDVDFRLSQVESRGDGPRQALPSSNSSRPGQTPNRPAEQARLSDLPSSTALPPSASTPAPASGSLGGGSAQDQYDEAFGLLRKADYDAAEKALAAFVGKHKDNPLAGNAQYWLAETFYVRGKYAEAAVAFADGFQKYPRNPKAPDNLLKLGMSLSALNQRDDACKTFSQLGSQFPTSAASLKRRADQERKKLNCP